MFISSLTLNVKIPHAFSYISAQMVEDSKGFKYQIPYTIKKNVCNSNIKSCFSNLWMNKRNVNQSTFV